MTYKKDRLYIMACGDRTRDNVFKRKKDKYRLQALKIFFTMRAEKLWNKLPKMFGMFTLLKVLEVRLA